MQGTQSGPNAAAAGSAAASAELGQAVTDDQRETPDLPIMNSHNAFRRPNVATCMPSITTAQCIFAECGFAMQMVSAAWALPELPAGYLGSVHLSHAQAQLLMHSRRCTESTYFTVLL